MPLAGIHACFMHAKGEFPSPDPMNGNKNPLIPDMDLNTRNMHLVEAKHVDPKDKKGTADLSPESLGFFSIVVSYAKAAANGKVNPDKGYVIFPLEGFRLIGYSSFKNFTKTRIE